jgi:hypothetical protein
MVSELHGIEIQLVSADIGKLQDHSAIAVVGRRWEVARRDIQPADTGPLNALYRYFVMYLKRFPIGTEYELVMQDYERLWGLPELQATRNWALMDVTGVGQPLAEALRRRKVPVIGITLTAGAAVTQPQPNEWHVPKVELVTQLGRMIQAGRLQVLDTVEAAAQFQEEVSGFGYKLHRETGKVQYEALEEETHDDLVVSVALAVWFAEHVIPPSIPGYRRRSHIAEEYEPLGKRR